MIESGQKIASMLSQVYTAYKGTGDWWLAEAAASFFAFGPAGPVGLALDTWWQSSRANQALARLSAARYVGQTWVNSMTDTWLPGFIDGIYEVDPTLGDQVSSTFDRVVVELNKIYDLTSDIGQLPPRAVTSLVSTFFGSIWGDVKSTGETLHALLAALGQIIREAGALAKTFPTIAVLAITGLAVYLTVK